MKSIIQILFAAFVVMLAMASQAEAACRCHTYNAGTHCGRFTSYMIGCKADWLYQCDGVPGSLAYGYGPCKKGCVRKGLSSDYCRNEDNDWRYKRTRPSSTLYSALPLHHPNTSIITSQPNVMKVLASLVLLGSLALATLAAPKSNLPTSDEETAIGYFKYSYTDSDDQTRSAILRKPKLNKCINIPELGNDEDNEDDDEVNRAFYPYNRSNAAAVVYTDPNCQGTPLYIPPNEPKMNLPFYFASVMFESAL
ncbi:hypothetical protein BGZ73_002913 [Actinomortierella ambigua]|nr:hypothetical protein BGZ73_002913 [Actinomortierella ambigua]